MPYTEKKLTPLEVRIERERKKLEQVRYDKVVYKGAIDASIATGNTAKNAVSLGALAAKNAAKEAGKLAAKQAAKEAAKQGLSRGAIKAAEKAALKAGSKSAGKVILKAIPVISVGVGIFFALRRIQNGQYLHAGLELASGIAGCVPGPGTAVAIGIDVGLIAGDLTDTVLQAKAKVCPESAKLLEKYPVPDDNVLKGFKGFNGFQIAISGDSGVGKSSLLNALRGYKMWDWKMPGFAKVANDECTKEPTSYDCDPGYEGLEELPFKLRYWDLPGAGTCIIESGRDYITRYGLMHFDAVILVRESRLSATAADIVTHLRNVGKPVFVVRTKWDAVIDVTMMKYCMEAPEVRDQMMRAEENEARNYLAEVYKINHKTFLVSSKYPEKYELETLKLTLGEAVLSGRSSNPKTS